MMGTPQLWVWVGSDDDRLDVMRYVRATTRDVLRQPVVEEELDRLRARLAEVAAERDQARARLAEAEDKAIAHILATMHCSDCPAWSDGDCPAADDTGGPECDAAIRAVLFGAASPDRGE